MDAGGKPKQYVLSISRIGARFFVRSRKCCFMLFRVMQEAHTRSCRVMGYKAEQPSCCTGSWL